MNPRVGEVWRGPTGMDYLVYQDSFDGSLYLRTVNGPDVYRIYIRPWFREYMAEDEWTLLGTQAVRS